MRAHTDRPTTARSGVRSRTRRPLAVGVLGLAVALVGSGCEWQGLNSVRLPGAEGRGDGAYTVTIDMPDVTTLYPNSPVRVNDVNVGSITSIKAEDYTAVVEVSLNPDVMLPKNAYAKIGQTSLLGSQHLELMPPPEGAPQGRLGDGDTIPISRAGVYPTTEQTLSALSVVLTDGGLQQMDQISGELNKALDGRQFQAKDVIHQLKTTVEGLDAQRQDIVKAMEGLDRLTGQIRHDNDTLARALRQLPEATRLLNDQKEELTGALVGLGDFGKKANTVIQNSGSDLTGNIRDLVPILESLASTGRNLTRVLNILITFPFPQNGMDGFLKGDFANLYVDADFTAPRMRETFFLGTDLGNRMSGLEGYVGLAPTANAAVDPFSLDVPGVPAAPGAAPAPAPAQTPAAAPASPSPSPAPSATPAPAPATDNGGGR